MKRIFAALAISLSSLIISLPAGAMSVDSGIGLGWTARFDSGDPVANAFMGARLAVWADVQWEFAPSICMGPEFGVSSLSWKAHDNSQIVLSDWSVLYKFGYKTSFLLFEGFIGPMLSLDVGTIAMFGISSLAGLRMSLGPLFPEGNLIWNHFESNPIGRVLYPRFYIGYRRSSKNKA